MSEDKISERIRAVRKACKITQEEFAAGINISRSNLGNIEIGRIGVTDRVISDICNTYGVAENWLRTGKGDMFRPKDTEDALIDAFGKLVNEFDESFVKQFVMALAELEPEGWKVIEKFALNVAKWRKQAGGGEPKEQSK